MPRSLLRAALTSTWWIALATAAPAQQGAEARSTAREVRGAEQAAHRAGVLPRNQPQPLPVPDPVQNPDAAPPSGPDRLDASLSLPAPVPGATAPAWTGAHGVRGDVAQPAGLASGLLTPGAGQRRAPDGRVRGGTGEKVRRRTPVWARPVFYVPLGLLGVGVAGYLLWPGGGRSTGTVVVTIPG